MKTQETNNKGTGKNDTRKDDKKKHSSALSAAEKAQSATRRVKPAHPGEDGVPGAGVLE